MAWWVLTLLYNSRAWTSLFTQAETNLADHLFMAWATWQPARTPIYRTVRGTTIWCGYKYIWDTPHIVEQNESGDTHTHTFAVAPLHPTDHVWYYLFAIAGPYGQPCQSALIHIEPPEIPMPSARIFHSVDQTIPATTFTYLTFDSELWDDGGFHSPAAPTRLTIPQTGLYAVGCCARFLTAVQANASCAIRQNGNQTIAYESHFISATGWAGAGFNLHTTMRFLAGDYLQIQVYNAAAGNKDIAADQLYSPHFWIVYLGPYPT